MGSGPITPREAAIAAGFTMASVCAIIFSWLAFGGKLPLQAEGYRVKMGFPDARTLVANADVRISGVPVGKVIKVTDGEDTSVAEVELQSRFAPLPSDARAIIRNKTPLGESFVEITRGTPGAKPIPEGGWLSRKNVDRTQQIEQVLDAFDEDTRKAFRTFVTDAAASFDGLAPDFNQALGAAGPAVEQAGIVVQALDRQSRDIEILVSRTGRALRAVGSRPDDLQRLVRAGDSVLSATAARNADLTATIRGFDAFVAELTPTMRALDHTLALAGPTLARLRPVAPLLTPALRRVDTISPVAARLLVNLRPMLRSLIRSINPTVALTRQLRPTAQVLDENGAEAIPALQLLDEYKEDAVWNLGTSAAAFHYEKPTGGGETSRYSRAAITFLSDGEAGGQEKRPFWNRSNAYPSPGSQIRRTSYDCRNTDNGGEPPLGEQAPCVEEAPWLFQGRRRSFPALSPYAPPDR